MTKRLRPKAREDQTIKNLQQKLLKKRNRKIDKEKEEAKTDNLIIIDVSDKLTQDSKGKSKIVVPGPIASMDSIEEFAKLAGLADKPNIIASVPIKMQPKKPKEEIKVSEETVVEAIKKEESEERKEKIDEIILNTVATQEEKTNCEEPTETKKETEKPKNIKDKSKTEKTAETKKPRYIPPPKADTDIEELTKALKTIISYITITKNEGIKLYNSIHDADLETTDLLHEIELNQLDIKEQVEMFIKLKEVRERRRTYKIRQAYFDEISTFNSMTPNLANKLTNLLNKLEEVKTRQDSAVYIPRIRTDIKESENIKYPGKSKK